MSNKVVYDLETLKCCFIGLFYNRLLKTYRFFEISEYENDLFSLVKFYNSENIEKAIGYNNLDFDAQVMEFILKNHQTWFDKSGKEVASIIYKFVQNLLEDFKYGVRPPYRSYTVEQIDCFKILGLDNAARMTSLKALQFNLRMKSVETMPIHHSVETLSRQEIIAIKNYCRNDVDSTSEVFDLINGESENSLYKGKDLTTLRKDIEREFGLKCENFSDLKIGDELMKLTYAKAIKKDVKDLPRSGTFRKSIVLKDCIPDYVNFNSKSLADLLSKIKATTLTSEDKMEYSIAYNGTRYTLALGGLHSANSNEIYKASEDYEIITADVASMYPATIINNKYYPHHLGKELLIAYEQQFKKRISLKPFTKTDKSAAAIADALKLVMNGVYGRLGSKESWLYDKKTLLSVTLTGQLSLLMLIEMLEAEGIHVIIANTDGIEAIVRKTNRAKYFEVCEKWEKITGYTLEYDSYSKIVMRDVNNYTAITLSGKVKQKGIFCVDKELWKDASMRIRAIALEKYFVNEESPEDVIRNHKDILDFCIRARTRGDDYLQLRFSDGSVYNQGNLLRYYLTKDSDAGKLYKVYHPSGEIENVAADNDLGVRRVAYYNVVEKKEDFKIDYDQYIYETYRVIAAIERNQKDRSFVEKLRNKQPSLF